MVAVVLGARGNVGRHVADGLLAAGEQVRAVNRTPAAGTAPGCEAVVADLARPETLPAAFDGGDKLFLYGMLDPQKPYDIEKVTAAAAAAGIRRVVLLSSVAVVLDPDAGHPVARLNRTIEQAVQRSGMDWTFLRPGTFAANTRTWWAESIRTDGVVRLPYPLAQSAPVHEKDIAALAVTALTEPGHSHQAYTVHGAESLTLRRQVEHIGEAVGRHIRVERVSEEQARADVARTMHPVVAEAIVSQWAAADGVAAATSVIAEKITGAPAHTYAQWAADHADDFR
ncbi:nucleotide-diphosphate-sugar epimerase [Kitasatospora xanthocidica]|uniref:SDR family oxidoreductase n=1 Tax=Kitasatospora xanthocidica TaxID=83382 RepID=UPI00167B3ADD|nr:NAD(P)H-binding protein [Kitasatospora xanthocidica]GHF78305.1 nucleotide-diphosphate-sugar epimerase [Kitasatospora xanthocidica]